MVTSLQLLVVIYFGTCFLFSKGNVHIKRLIIHAIHLASDGPSVLPTGRNIHALDPYRMPSAGAWARGQRIAKELIRQHREANEGKYPETVAVTMWGLDAIKTRGESVAIALSLVGAQPVKEGTGRIVRFDLTPLEELDRPRIDVLASLSGIFR